MPMNRPYPLLYMCSCAFLLALSFSVFADTLTGQVIRVADGDTVTVLDHWKTQHRIRLQGIDAPERGQPYGKASGKHLSGLVAGRFVMVEYDKRDRYGRVVGKVLLSGEDVQRNPNGRLQCHCLIGIITAMAFV